MHGMENFKTYFIFIGFATNQGEQTAQARMANIDRNNVRPNSHTVFYCTLYYTVKKKAKFTLLYLPSHPANLGGLFLVKHLPSSFMSLRENYAVPC
jgi:hypothetical protein